MAGPCRFDKAYGELCRVVGPLEGVSAASVYAAHAALQPDPAGAFRAAMCAAVDELAVADRQAKEMTIGDCKSAIQAASVEFNLVCAAIHRRLLSFKEKYERVLALGESSGAGWTEIEVTVSAALVEYEAAKQNYYILTSEILATSRRVADERYAAMLATIAALTQIVHDLTATGE